MTDTGYDLLLLSTGIVAVLLVLTVAGEWMRRRLPPGRSSGVADSFVTRIESWWIMAILLGLAVLGGFVGVLLLFAFVSFAALREFLTLTHKTRADHLSLALAFFAVLPAQYVLVGLGWTELFSILIPIYAFLLLPVLSALRGEPDRFLVRVAETQWGLMICVFCASHVPALMALRIAGNSGRGVLLIVFFVLVIQLADLIGYVAGQRTTRRRIAPEASRPTIGGAVCAVTGGAVAGAALSWITPFGIAGAMGVAAVACAMGLAGTLVFTAIKRERGVRDWSHLIPGQGGILDQLGSVIFAAPVFYHLTAYGWAD